jgi:hypothetical protein
VGTYRIDARLGEGGMNAPVATSSALLIVVLNWTALLKK